MPTYEYACSACGHKFEEFQSIKAPPIKKCPKCGKLKVQRLISAGAGFIFKGSGFYETDYRSDKYKADAKADSAPSTTPAKTDTPAIPASGTTPATPATPAAAPTPAPAAESKPAPKSESPKSKPSKKSSNS